MSVAINITTYEKQALMDLDKGKDIALFYGKAVVNRLMKKGLIVFSPAVSNLIVSQLGKNFRETPVVRILTPYELSCGYIQEFECKILETRVQLYLDGVYHVKCIDDRNTRVAEWDSFDTLTEARKRFEYFLKIFTKCFGE